MAHNIKYDIMELILKEEKHLNFIQRPKQSNNVTFDADPDIYMAKNMKVCNVNQWDFYNSITDNLHKMISVVTRYLPIICLSKMIFNA